MPKEKHSKNAKPKLTYEAPKVVALGESDTGFGGPCQLGSAVPALCKTGGVPGAACLAGLGAIPQCNPGISGK
jgi:hypothetical protein